MIQFDRIDTSQGDFQTGTANSAVANSNGALELQKGSSYSNTTTETADFGGTHSNTQAINNNVQLINGVDSNTTLLIQANGISGSNDFTDETGKTLTVNGDAEIDTARYKYGGSSAYFDGSGDYLTVNHHTDHDFGTDDFTIDFWFNQSALAHNKIIIGKGISTAWEIFTDNNTNPYIGFVWRANSLNLYSGTVSTNAWHHVAIVRSSGTITLYLNGVSKASGSASMASDSTNQNIDIGSISGGGFYYNGWLDEIRISKGIARWTSNFTPPTSQYGGYQASGTYTHTPQDVSGGEVANNFTISYSKTIPANTTLSVEVRTSSDGGTTWGDWSVKNSGDTIIPNGTNLSNYRVQWRANLSTTDTTVTPSLDDVTISNTANYISPGTYTSPEINIYLPGSASGSAVGWNSQDAVVGGNVVSTILVETSLSTDGTTWGDWQTATNGGQYQALHPQLI